MQGNQKEYNLRNFYTHKQIMKLMDFNYRMQLKRFVERYEVSKFEIDTTMFLYNQDEIDIYAKETRNYVYLDYQLRKRELTFYDLDMLMWIPEKACTYVTGKRPLFTLARSKIISNFRNNINWYWLPDIVDFQINNLTIREIYIKRNKNWSNILNYKLDSYKKEIIKYYEFKRILYKKRGM